MEMSVIYLDYRRLVLGKMGVNIDKWEIRIIWEFFRNKNGGKRVYFAIEKWC